MKRTYNKEFKVGACEPVRKDGMQEAEAVKLRR